jgi:hypothetical protein
VRRCLVIALRLGYNEHVVSGTVLA